MAGQGESGWLKSLQTMAPLAAIGVGCGRELGGMRVFVAIGATLELELVERGFAPGDMALCARHRFMLALQWVSS